MIKKQCSEIWQIPQIWRDVGMLLFCFVSKQKKTRDIHGEICRQSVLLMSKCRNHATQSRKLANANNQFLLGICFFILFQF